MWKLLFFIIFCIVSIITLKYPELNTFYTEGGKFSILAGIWDGCLIPFNLILSFFIDSVTLIESDNDGFFYCIGYIIGLYFFIKFLKGLNALGDTTYN